MDRQFKPFRYLTPKPKKYLDIHKKYKPIKESKAIPLYAGMYQNAVGLIFLAASLGFGIGLIINKCTENIASLEQKVENYYKEQIYNFPDNYFKN